MSKTNKSSVHRASQSGRFVMTRSSIAKLNAVEGVRQSASSQRLFLDLDRKGSTREERRRAVAKMHTPKG